MKTIVIAWADMTGLEKTNQMERFDGVNWRYKMKPTWKGHAALWLARGSEQDIQKARAYAEKQEPVAFVVTFETSDRQWKQKAEDVAVNHAVLAAMGGR